MISFHGVKESITVITATQTRSVDGVIEYLLKTRLDWFSCLCLTEGWLKNIYPASELEVEKMIKLIYNLFLTYLTTILHIKAKPLPTLSVSSGETKLTSAAFELFCEYVSWLHISAEVIRNMERNALRFIKVIQMNPGWYIFYQAHLHVLLRVCSQSLMNYSSKDLYIQTCGKPPFWGLGLWATAFIKTK